MKAVIRHHARQSPKLGVKVSFEILIDGISQYRGQSYDGDHAFDLYPSDSRNVIMSGEFRIPSLFAWLFLGKPAIRKIVCKGRPIGEISGPCFFKQSSFSSTIAPQTKILLFKCFSNKWACETLGILHVKRGRKRQVEAELADGLKADENATLTSLAILLCYFLLCAKE